MGAERTEYRLAILLNALGSDVIEPALAQLPASSVETIRKHLDKIEASPPDIEEIAEALDEFEVFLKFAVDTLKTSSGVSETLNDVAAAAPKEDLPPKPTSTLKLFEPTDDPVYDLQRLDPRQLAAALSKERPKTISLVLSLLDQPKAATTIDLLPEEIQSETFMLLRSPDSPPEELVNRVATTIVAKAAESEPVDLEEPDADHKLAQLLRELPKKTRSRLVDEIQEKDEETATRLRELLYVFEDIVLYDNRSVQKILSSIETSVLVAALQTAGDEIHAKIFDNLSKRATASLKEELSFAPKLSEEEVTEAQSTIAATIGELDGAGEITLL